MFEAKVCMNLGWGAPEIFCEHHYFGSHINY